MAKEEQNQVALYLFNALDKTNYVKFAKPCEMQYNIISIYKNEKI